MPSDFAFHEETNAEKPTDSAPQQEDEQENEQKCGAGPEEEPEYEDEDEIDGLSSICFKYCTSCRNSIINEL